MKKEDEPTILFVNTARFSNKLSELNYNEYKQYVAVTENRVDRKQYISLDVLLSCGISLDVLTACGVELSTEQKAKLKT